MKKKNIIIGIIAVVISIIGMLSISICSIADKNVKYTFKLDNDIKLKNVYINDNKISLGKLKKQGENLIIDEEKELLFAKDTENFEIETSIIDSVYIEFVNDGTSDIVVRKNGIIQEFKGDTYSYYRSIFNITREALSPYSILFFILMLPVSYLAIYFIYSFFERVKENNLKVYNIILFALGVFLIFLSTFYFLLSVSEILIIVEIVLALIIGVYILRKENLKNIFVYMGVIMGVAMMFLVPPYNVPDESSHFCKSFKMSYFKNEDDGGYTKLPKFLEDFSSKYLHSVHKQGINYSGVNYFSDLYLNCDYEDNTEMVNVNYTNTKYLSFLAYVPSALVIFIGRNLGFSPLLLLLASRFIDLLIVVILAYFALKTTPKFKKIFFIVCLFPIFLQQAAAINQDYLTNISCIFFVAYVLKCKYSNKALEKKDKIILFATALIIAFCKFGYFPIILTLLLIPNEKFKNKKESFLWKIGLLIFTIITSYIVSSAMAPSLDGQTGEYYSLNYIFSHPFDTIKIYYNTIITRLQSDLLLSLFDGFLYSTVSHKQTLGLILALCYLVLIFNNDEHDVKLSKKERCILILIAVMLFGIIYTAAFIGWTTLSSRTIWGIQSRYFIPALLLLYIGISSSHVNIKCKNKNMMYSGIIIFVYAITIFTIITSVYR